MKFCEYGPRTLAGFSLARKYYTTAERQTVTNTSLLMTLVKAFYCCGPRIPGTLKLLLRPQKKLVADQNSKKFGIF